VAALAFASVMDHDPHLPLEIGDFLLQLVGALAVRSVSLGGREKGREARREDGQGTAAIGCSFEAVTHPQLRQRSLPLARSAACLSHGRRAERRRRAPCRSRGQKRQQDDRPLHSRPVIWLCPCMSVQTRVSGDVNNRDDCPTDIACITVVTPPLTIFFFARF